jgi:hypothetical protein
LYATLPTVLIKVIISIGDAIAGKVCVIFTTASKKYNQRRHVAGYMPKKLKESSRIISVLQQQYSHPPLSL